MAVRDTQTHNKSFTEQKSQDKEEETLSYLGINDVLMLVHQLYQMAHSGGVLTVGDLCGGEGEERYMGTCIS